jgi:tetratricopeptide (TPR) repeat protein
VATAITRLAALLETDTAAAAELASAIEADQPVAAMVARAAIETKTSDPVLHQLQLGSLHVLAGDHELAATIARAALPRCSSLDHRMAAATVLIGAHCATDAIAILEALLEAAPHHRDAYLRLATAAFQLGDIHAAIGASARAFELDPAEPTPIRNVMNICAFDGTPIGAIAVVEELRAGTLRPGVAIVLDIAHIELMRAATMTFPPPGADATCDEVVEHLVELVKTSSVVIQLAAARTLLHVGRSAEARPLMHDISQLPSLTSDERAELLLVEGLGAQYAGDRDLAVERYVAALAERSSLADAATNAIAILLDGNNPDAIDHVETILDMVDSDVRERSPALREAATTCYRLRNVAG